MGISEQNGRDEVQRQRGAAVMDFRTLDSAPREWPTLDEVTLLGVAGDVTRSISAHSESDRAAILVQVLTAFGCFLGRNCHYRVEGDLHYPNLFCLLVGGTSKGRKGTSWGRVRQLFEPLPGWVNVASGLSSGEGLKWHVRDATEGKGDAAGDPGVTDKRLLVVEPEFSSVLKATARNGNNLSSTIRESWDSGRLRTLTRNDPITATGAHIGIIGHITADELRSELTEVDRANGFINRFLLICVRRSQILPFGGLQLDDRLAEELGRNLNLAAGVARRHAGPVGMTAAAKEIWINVYPQLSEGLDGLLGSVTARAEAQCVRIALLYALLDGCVAIDERHLGAALGLWRYAEASARFIFGSALGHRVADEIYRALRVHGSSGMTRTEISNLFKRNEPAERIAAALEILKGRRLATCEMRPTEGRPVEVWRVLQ